MMHDELSVQPGIYNRCKFPSFQRPKVIGYIGFENIKFARKIYDRIVEFDLNHLLNEAKRREQLDVKLDKLLQFLLNHKVRLNYPLINNFNEANIFCYRGLMTCLACTPYENNDPWKIVAILFKGNIYLCARLTDKKKQWIANLSEKDKRFLSWGYKFEQYMLSDRIDSDPNPNEPVDENPDFSIIFTTNINGHKIVYGAEIDGIICDKDSVSPPPVNGNPEEIINYLSDKKLIELKTSRHIENHRQDINFRCFKTIKWWCQSFLAGIDKIICGFRNDAGIVEEVKQYNIRELAKMSKRYWSPNVCLNFVDTFFTHVKRCLANEVRRKHGDAALQNTQKLPLISLLFEWIPDSTVKVVPNYDYIDDPILLTSFVDQNTFGA